MSRPGFVVLLAMCLALAAVGGEPYPEPAPLKNDSSLGEGVQRTMTLLAASTKQHRNRVRILFYGQSITASPWTKLVEDDLRKRFPDADIEAANKAIGGFASQLLVRTMDYDVFPFYPDLVVFHVYGSHEDYERIIAGIRQRTTAEIVMQSDHLQSWPEQVSGDNPWKWPWTENMNRNLLPAIAKKFDVPLVNIRGEWEQYLKDNNLQPKNLLSDNIHLNAHGQFLMARLICRYLTPKPNAPADKWKSLVRTYEIGKDVQWAGNKLVLEFEGNRVELLASAGEPGAASVRIDGKKPSDFPELYTVTRPSGTPAIGWPAIKKISSQKPLVLETWTASFSGFNEKQDDFKFDVSGSVTGADGSGQGAAKFVSNSGRVVIEPTDWVFAYDKQVGQKAAPDGFKVTWKVIPLFVDTYESPKVEDPAKECATVVASGLANAKHTLELTADGAKPPLKAIRVYAPPVK